MRKLLGISAIGIVAAVLASCSTTKVLGEGEYRLAKADVKVLNDKDFKESDLQSYIKQKPNSNFIFGWHPGLNVYNWQNGKGKGWDKFVQKIGVAPVVYDPDLVDESIKNIRNHLEYLGYYNSSVTSSIRVRRKKVYVQYGVTLGNRFTISDIRYHLPDNEAFSADFRADIPHSGLKVGDYLSESALETESVRAANVMRDKGFYNFNKNFFFFRADTLSSDGRAALDVSINEYTRNETENDAVTQARFTIGEVTISYPNSLNIRKKILYELNTVHSGDLYSDKNIRNTYSRFTSLKMFSSVNIGTTPADSNRVDCHIQLIQSKLQGFKINLETSVNSTGLFGVSPQLSYYHKNIFHGGEWLNLSFMGNFQFNFKQKIRSTEFGVSSSLSFPKFIFLPYRFFKGASIPRTDVSVSYNYQNRPEYKRNIISTSFGFTGNLKSRFFYQAYPLQLNIVHLSNMTESFRETLYDDPYLFNAYQDHFDFGAGATFYYTTNSDVNPKTDYSYVRLQTDIAGNVLSIFKPLMKKNSEGYGMLWDTPYSQFVRAELTLGHTWRFGKEDRQALACRFVAGAGYAYGNSTVLPFEKHFYAGGANSLRGWQARCVGPGTSEKDDTFKIPNQTGDMKLEANLEYRFPLFWKFAFAVFADAGNVWAVARDSSDEERFSFANLGKSLAFNWGTGLRLDFDFLVLRLDWGLKLHDPAREDGSRWLTPGDWFKKDKSGYALHFGVGYPF